MASIWRTTNLHILGVQRTSGGMKDILQHPWIKRLLNITCIHRRSFICNMQECNNLLNHINNIKAFANQLAYLKVPMRDKNIVMTLLERLFAFHKYLIMALETMPMKELIMEYVKVWLVHKISKRKKKEPQGDNVTMILQQNKAGNSFPHQSGKTYFYCGKPGHITHFCLKAKKKYRENAKNANNNDDYAFVMQHKIHLRSTCKWTIDLDEIKHITLHKAIFGIYELIPPHDLHLDNDSVVEAIEMNFIVIKMVIRGKANRIRIMDVLHVSKLQVKLLLVSKLVSSRLKVQFNFHECIVVICDGKAIAIKLHVDNLYQMNFLNHCKGMKTYRLMCLKTKMIIKIKTWYSWIIAWVLKLIYRCIQMEKWKPYGGHCRQIFKIA